MSAISFRRLSLYLAILLALPVCCSVTPAFGQGITTGTISGTITDPSGAVVSGAAVTALDTSKGTTLTTQSGADGAFSIRLVPIGTYRVTVSSSGFSGAQVDDVLVRAG